MWPGLAIQALLFRGEPKTRKFVGYDVDICDAIAAKMGVKPEFVFITGATRVTDLQSGPHRHRAGQSHPRAGARDGGLQQQLLCRSGEGRGPGGFADQELADLTGKRMSGTSGSNLEIKMPKVTKGVDLKAFPSPANAFLALEQGKVEAMAGDETTLLGLIRA